MTRTEVRGATVTTTRRARALLVVAGIVTALAFAEIATRSLVPGPPRPRITEPPGISPFEKTPQGLYVYTPGVSFSHVYDVAFDRRGYFGAHGRVDYRINDLGFRGKPMSVEKPPGVRRILCLGDSFTFGEGVHENDAWPQRLGHLAGPGTEVINAGVQGYDLDHEGLFLLLYGRRLKPDVVVIGFFMNDSMPVGETAAHHGLLIEPHAQPSRISRLSALWRMLEQRRFAARQTSRYLVTLRQSFSSPHWTEVKGRMGRLRKMADLDGFRVVALIFPLLHDFDDYPLEGEHAEVRKAFGDAGIEVVDLLDSYRSHHRGADLWVHPVDPHPNEIAHSIAAEELARRLKASGG